MNRVTQWISAASLFICLGAVSAQPIGRTIMLGGDRPMPAVIKPSANRIVLIFRGPGTSSRVEVLDRLGIRQFVRQPAADAPGAIACTVRDATVTQDGVLVVAVVLLSAAGQGAPSIIEYDISRQRLLRIVRTAPLRCDAIAPDGDSIWCLGTDTEAEAAGGEYDVVRRLSLNGEILQGLFPRTAFSSQPDEWLGPTEPVLVAGGERFVAWLPASRALLVWGSRGADARRLEFSPRASEAHGVPDRLAVRSDGSLIGLLAVGSVAGRPELPRRALFAINAQGHPQRLMGSAGEEVSQGMFLAGCEGDYAVFYRPAENSIEWVPLGPSESQ